jgi:hypothetical protein
MLRHVSLKALLVGCLAAALAGCSGSGDDDDSTCTPPDVSGSTFVTTGDGQAHGKGELPAGVKDGSGINVGVDVGNASGDIFPDNLFMSTCGKTFTYTARGLGPATYRLTYRIYDQHSEQTPTLFEGISTNQFTITSNEDVEFNPTF